MRRIPRLGAAANSILYIVVAEATGFPHSRRMPGFACPRRVVRSGFSADEWAVLVARHDFISLLNQVASLDDAESIIRYGTDLLEAKAERPFCFDGWLQMLAVHRSGQGDAVDLSDEA